jgi:hypothetical protein
MSHMDQSAKYSARANLVDNDRQTGPQRGRTEPTRWYQVNLGRAADLDAAADRGVLQSSRLSPAGLAEAERIYLLRAERRGSLSTQLFLKR